MASSTKLLFALTESQSASADRLLVESMIKTCRIADEMEEGLDCRVIHGKIYSLYGEPALYREESYILIKPLVARSTDKRSLNQTMSRVQECVKWEFEHVASLFPLLKFRQGQKLRLGRVELFYVMATFLKNVHICINCGGQTSMHFAVLAPILEHYIKEITQE